MLVKLKVSLSGPSVGSHMPGAVVDWPDDDAPNLIRAGYAEVVRETAALEVPEKTVQPAPIRRKKVQ